ncbi:MAG: glycosyltransferase family 4 protein [Patescibacteria group bacterium]
MKIAQIVCRYPPYYGGMGNVVFQTASFLSAIGHDVTVFTPDYYPESEIKPVTAPVDSSHEPELQTEIDYAKRLKPSLSYGNAARLPDMKKELDGFDLVHLHYPFFGTNNLVRNWKLKNPELPLVITYHMDSRSTGWKGLILKYYAEYWMPRILGSADALIASSFDYMAASDAAGFFNATEGKWHELPFGVDAERFAPRPKPEKLAAAIGLDPRRPTILFVGGMDSAHHFKGIPILLQALANLKKNGLSVQTVFVGEGNLRAGFVERTKNFGLQDQVFFAGGVSDADLPGFYNLADLFVLPSTTKSEAFGMVLLEAMASGVPVVGSDLPGVRAVAAEGGLTARPGDPYDLAECIMGYFAKGNNRDEWTKKVRTIVEEKYSWEKIIAKLDNIYGAVAGNS